MSAIFSLDHHKRHTYLEKNREDILFIIQVPVALIALAALFFLSYSEPLAVRCFSILALSY